MCNFLSDTGPSLQKPNPLFYPFYIRQTMELSGTVCNLSTVAIDTDALPVNIIFNCTHFMGNRKIPAATLFKDSR